MTRAPLDADMAQRLADFARACKAAVRAVSLYPGGHPAITSTLARLTELSGGLTASGPLSLEIRPHTIGVNDAVPARPDSAVIELSDLLRKQLVGRLTLNPGVEAESWRTLLMLLGRPPDEVRGDGGIAALWSTAGGPSIEIVEIDYAEVLREKQGDQFVADRLVAAALSGQLELDESGMRALVEIVGDPARLTFLMEQLEARTAGRPGEIHVGAFLNLLRGLADYVHKTSPQELDETFRRMGPAAGRLSAEGMLEFLLRRNQPEAMAGGVDVVTSVVQQMSNEAVAGFVSRSIVSERGATDRLAEAFQALVPDRDRQTEIVALAEPDVAASDLGQETAFQEMWQRIESMLTSYTDDKFVSDAYARELSSAREKAVDVEAAGGDPPERIQAWLSSVGDSALRGLDDLLLQDLLRLEEDGARWRDIAETVIGHVEGLVRVNYFDQAFQLAALIAAEGMRVPSRQTGARAALERLGQGTIIKQAARHLRTADDDDYGLFKLVCHSIGTTVIPPLAEALSSEQDARSRRRLQDILVGFGAAGRESVQQLMSAPNWEVRRTAAYLLREFGGVEGLRELKPLLSDHEPLVQREAIQALMFNGSDAAARILIEALTSTPGRPRATLISELSSTKDERAAPLFCYLVRHLDRKAFPTVYLGAIQALGTHGGPDGVDVLREALQRGDWFAPMRTRRARVAAAQALARIGSDAALTALHDATKRGPRGVRAAAKSALGGR